MNEKLLQAIKNYLQQDTHSALMITGEWGSGKTHFIKNDPEFKKVIADYLLTKNKKNPSKEALYATLNGITELEQVYNALIFKNKNTEKFLSIANKVLDKWTGIDLKGFNINFADLIEFRDGVLIFNDLERISDTLKIQDVLGFINSNFVEHAGIKTIIICDETKNQLEYEDYQKAKEKLIGWTAQYTPIFKETLPILFQKKKHKNPKYFEFLTIHTDLIITTFQDIAEYKNLRTVLFFLDVLEIIFEKINGKDYELIHPEIIYFTAVVSIEYKKGKMNDLFNLLIDTKEGRDFKNPMTSKNTPQDEPKEATYAEKFNEIYRNSSWNYLNDFINHTTSMKNYHDYTNNRIPKPDFEIILPIYFLITTGSLDETPLIKELDAIHNAKKERQTSKILIAVQKIRNLYSISNEELEKLIKSLLDWLKNDTYILDEFYEVGRQLLRLTKNELIPMSYDEMENKLITRANDCISIKDERFIQSSDYYIDENDQSDFPTKIREIREKLLTEKNVINYQETFQNWHTTISHKTNDLAIFMNTFPITDIAQKVCNWTKTSPRSMNEFNWILRNFYKNNNPRSDAFQNAIKYKEKFIELKDYIKDYIIQNSIDGVERWRLNETIKIIAEILQNK